MDKKLTNLAVIYGEKTTVKNGVIHYNPVYLKSKNDDSNPKELREADVSDIRSDFIFSQGIIEFKFKAENKKTGALISNAAVNLEFETTYAIDFNGSGLPTRITSLAKDQTEIRFIAYEYY